MDELNALNELKTALVELKTQMARNSNNNRSSAIVQSGGPMWVCVLLVAVALTYALAKDGSRSDVVVQQQAQIAALTRKVDRLEDYETTAYMLFPEFRKQIEQSLNKRKEK